MRAAVILKLLGMLVGYFTLAGLDLATQADPALQGQLVGALPQLLRDPKRSLAQNQQVAPPLIHHWVLRQ
jgi:hypothetical protein